VYLLFLPYLHFYFLFSPRLLGLATRHHACVRVARTVSLDVLLPVQDGHRIFLQFLVNIGISARDLPSSKVLRLRNVKRHLHVAGLLDGTSAASSHAAGRNYVLVIVAGLHLLKI
jgi:hypothetical protein